MPERDPRVAVEATLISPENMTTGDRLAQVVINAPDRAAMLMSRAGKGDQLTDDDDVTGTEPESLRMKSSNSYWKQQKLTQKDNATDRSELVKKVMKTRCVWWHSTAMNGTKVVFSHMHIYNCRLDINQIWQLMNNALISRENTGTTNVNAV